MSRIIERTLVIIGLACLGYYGLAAADAAHEDHEARQVVARELAVQSVPTTAYVPSSQLAERTPHSVRPAAKAPSRDAVPSSVVGLLEIPRLNFSTPVLEGDDAKTLRGAAGHLPDTPQPWEEGNSAIAAHRDGVFRPLRHLEVGDEVRVQTRRGPLRYRVTDTHIVTPTDLSVLEAKAPQMLTLITCYPFNYVGPAPKRFVVHAERIFE